MAGKKGRSGRKSNADIVRARGLIGTVISDKRWKEIIENLAKLAEGKAERPALEAFSILAKYAFGVPTESNSVDEPEKEISVIRIIDPGEKDSAPNDD